MVIYRRRGLGLHDAIMGVVIFAVVVLGASWWFGHLHAQVGEPIMPSVASPAGATATVPVSAPSSGATPHAWPSVIALALLVATSMSRRVVSPTAWPWLHSATGLWVTSALSAALSGSMEAIASSGFSPSVFTLFLSHLLAASTGMAHGASAHASGTKLADLPPPRRAAGGGGA